MREIAQANPAETQMLIMPGSNRWFCTLTRHDL